MQPRFLLLLLAAIGTVSAIGFQSGRQSARATDVEKVERAGETSPPRRLVASHEPDFSRVTIANIGAVEFEEAYDLLRAASPATLAGWARQLQAMPAGPARATAITSFFKVLVQTDPTRAVDLVLGLTNREARSLAGAAVQGGAPESAFPEVARMLVELDEDSLTEFVLLWSRFDPVSTSRFVEEHPSKMDSNAIALLLENWAAIDPLAAQTWLDGLDPKKRKPDVVEGFVSGWFESDRSAALAYLAAHADEKVYRRGIRSAARTLFAKSPSDAGSFVTQLQNPAARAAAVDEITAYATDRVLGGNLTFPAEAVARWMITLPEDTWKNHLGAVLSSWSSADPAAAEAWLNQMPLPARDQMAAEFCANFDWQAPQSGVIAGLRISDPTLRANSLAKLRKRIGTREEASEIMLHLQLAPRDKAEIEKALADL